MAYYRVDMYLNPWQKLFFPTSIQIFNTFKKEIDKFEIEYLNFNNYNDKDGRDRVAVRFESKNEKAKDKAEEIGKQLKSNNLINSFEINVVKDIPNSVKIAGEFASICASELAKHKEFFEQLNKHQINFVLYFFKIMLEKMNYTIYVSWDSTRAYTKKVRQDVVKKLADACMQYKPKKVNVYNDPDFIERFIHLFLNCAMLQQGNFEKEVWRMLTISNFCNSICRTLHKE